MKITFSLHAEQKFSRKEIKSLRITKELVKKTIKSPEIILPKESSKVAIRKLNKDFSLCVPYRETDAGVKIITFFPAKRGRYESKVF